MTDNSAVGSHRLFVTETEFGPDTLASLTPMGQFGHWFQEVCDHRPHIKEPYAVALATVDSEGVPHLRMVANEAFNKEGFYIFTEYNSPKGKQMASNSHVALVFFWSEVGRQVRVEGTAERITAEESESYFHKQDRGLQILECLGQQSSVIKDREVMEHINDEIEARHPKGTPLTKPDFWGGYLIRPTRVEFYQAKSNYLMDRIQFRRKTPDEVLDPELSTEGEDGWVIERLMP